MQAEEASRRYNQPIKGKEQDGVIRSIWKLPSLWGNIDSSSSWPSIQSIKYSTYFGAETSIGFFICTPSAHLYSYLKKAIYPYQPNDIAF